MRSLLLLLAAVLVCGGCQKDQTDRGTRTHEVVADVIDAYGGREALGRVWGYRASGRLHAAHRGVLVHTARWFVRPDRLLLELDYPDGPEWRLTRGPSCWKGTTPEKLVPARGPMEMSMQLQTARFDLPLRLLEHVDDLVLLAPDDRGRIVLRHDWGNGLRLDYHVDPESSRVTRVTMGMTGPPAMEFAADYSGFRVVDGVLFPHREVTWAGGVVTSKVVIDTFMTNADGLAAKVAVPTADI